MNTSYEAVSLGHEYLATNRAFVGRVPLGGVRRFLDLACGAGGAGGDGLDGAAAELAESAGGEELTHPMRAGPLYGGIHHISPRFIGHVPHSSFGPLQGFGFTRLVLGHLSVGGFQILADHVGAHQRLDELANMPPVDDGMQPCVDALTESDG